MRLFRSRDDDVLAQVQKEREQIKALTPNKPLNKFLVGRNCSGNAIAILQPPRELISKVDALLLAAYLVKNADTSHDLGAFKSVLHSIEQAGN